MASILAVCRQGVYYIPAILLLPNLFGLTGIQIAQPVSDILVFLTAIVIGLRVLKELKQNQAEVTVSAAGEAVK